MIRKKNSNNEKIKASADRERQTNEALYIKERYCWCVRQQSHYKIQKRVHLERLIHLVLAVVSDADGSCSFQSAIWPARSKKHYATDVFFIFHPHFFVVRAFVFLCYEYRPIKLIPSLSFEDCPVSALGLFNLESRMNKKKMTKHVCNV